MSRQGGGKARGGVAVEEEDVEREWRGKKKTGGASGSGGGARKEGMRPSQRLRDEREAEDVPDGPPYTALISNIPPGAKDADVFALLGADLAAQRTAAPRWTGGGRQLFIDMASPKALADILSLNGRRVGGSLLRVEKAKPLKKQGSNSKKNKGGTGKDNNGRGGGRDRPKFKEYLPADQVQKMLADGLLCQAALRVNPHNRREAYATVPGFPFDIKFRNLAAQNRALDGDLVAVQVNSPSDWIKMEEDDPRENEVLDVEADLSSQDEDGEAPDQIGKSEDEKTEEENMAKIAAALSELQLHQKQATADSMRPTGKVVAILKPAAEAPTFVGWLRSCGGDDEVLESDAKFAFFIPFSKRMHRILVPLDRLPSSWRSAEAYRTHLYACQVTSWKVTSTSPFGKLVKDYGEGGTLEVEKTILLEANNIDYDDSFSPAVNACLPQKDYVISAEEIAKRRDLRASTLICSIDPATARDLDDALSIERLPNGNWSVGVHIADVTHFLHANTALDDEARSRCTSVYLVDQCIPMLPRILSERLCSLNSGQDCLAFSAIFELSPRGEVLSEWFGKTVIRNAMQMSYEIAQSIIDGQACDEDFRIDPATRFTIGDVKAAVLNLNSLAHVMRTTRYESGGSVTLESVKLTFKLDEATGMPVSCAQYRQKPANELVEEFMLLANRRVGEFILRKFPDGALLRRHEKPGLKMKDFVSMCAKFGYKIDATTSKALNSSLEAVHDPKKPGVRQVIYHLALRAMQLARYTQTDPDFPADSYYWHYALAFPVYTHFTSPIRRYADCMVHRILFNALSGLPQPEDKESIKEVCENCNERKIMADRAGDRSDVVFLCHYLKDRPVEVLEGYVYRITAKGFDVMCPHYGIEDAVMLDRLGLVKETHFDEDKFLLSCTFDSYNPDYFLGQKVDEENDRRPLTLNVEMFQRVRVICRIKDGKRELDMGLRVIIDEEGL